MEKTINVYDVLFCYYEDNNKVYKERSFWNFTVDDARNEGIHWGKKQYGKMFVEVVRVKQIESKV